LDVTTRRDDCDNGERWYNDGGNAEGALQANTDASELRTHAIPHL